MRSDLDLFLCHDQRAIEQREIADRALPVVPDGEGAACVARNVFADDDGARFFASKFSKNLRGLAIKAVAECDIRRDRLRPPIAFDVPIFSNVAHEFGVWRPVAALKARTWPRPPEWQIITLRWKFSRCIKFRVNAAAG